MFHPGDTLPNRRVLRLSERPSPGNPPVEESVGEKLGSLAQQLRAHSDLATLSFLAIKAGGVGLQGATSAALESSLAAIRDLVDRSLADARLVADARPQHQVLALDAFIADVRRAAGFDAATHQCELVVSDVAPGLHVDADLPMLNAAVSILLQNAFRYTRPHGSVCLDVRRAGDRILIEVEDQCGGFPAAPGRGGNHTEHGLSIVRRAIEANGGTLRLRNVAGIGCTLAIDLPAWRA